MSGGEIGVLMICLFILTILLGFPIVFTLMGMGVFFGYYAYATPDQIHHIFENRIFDLLVQNTFSILSNDTLTAVPLFLFMGYVVERANILDRLFFSIQIAARRIPGSLAVATLITCALFATAVGIVGAVVTLMGLLAFPAMLKAGYDTKLAAGVICAGGCLGILIPPSILLILYAATAGESVVKLYAAAFIPGFVLAGFYILYVVVRVLIDPKLAPSLADDQAKIPIGKVLYALLTSFFPLAVLILSVLGAILLGLATPTEAAAVGSFGSLVLAAGYRQLDFQRLKEAVYLTAKTTAMVTYLFVGSWTFASVFAYLG
ncbi:MAG: TRAP transporter large permease, partial [Terriglobia bacterium]